MEKYNKISRKNVQTLSPTEGATKGATKNAQ